LKTARFAPIGVLRHKGSLKLIAALSLLAEMIGAAAVLWRSSSREDGADPTTLPAP
jgi:hypothetical protein